MRRFPTGLLLALALPACADPDYRCYAGEQVALCISRRDVRAFDPRLDYVLVQVRSAGGVYAFGAVIGDSLVNGYDPRTAGYLDSLNRVVNALGRSREVYRDENDSGRGWVMQIWVGDDPSWLREPVAKHDYVCQSNGPATACISRRDVRAFDPRLDHVRVSVNNAGGMDAYEAIIGDSIVRSYSPAVAPAGYLDSLKHVIRVRGQFRRVERDEIARKTLGVMQFWVGEEPSWLRE